MTLAELASLLIASGSIISCLGAILHSQVTRQMLRDHTDTKHA